MSGCGHNADNSHLALVDSLLAQDKSEEALQVLQAINTSTYNNSDKAYHALLTTQAQQECHITATSDSAINMAVKYYQAHNDKERLARALLYQGSVNKDLGQLDKAITSLRQAEDAYKRLSTLYERGTLPEIRMVEMETQLAKARAAEQISRKSLKDIVLRAPFSGYIAQRMVHEGAAASPGLGGFKLVKIDQVKVKLSVPENEIGDIHVGQEIAFKVPALDGRRYVGRVQTKGVQASILSHSYDVKLIVGNPRHELLPGMVVNVTTDADDTETLVTVPVRSIQQSADGKQFVWLAKNGKATRQPVEVGQTEGDRIVILTGLTEGDKVIIEGYQKVSEGSQVK